MILLAQKTTTIFKIKTHVAGDLTNHKISIYILFLWHHERNTDTSEQKVL